jgi:lysyl-tRNA synthetase class 2
MPTKDENYIIAERRQKLAALKAAQIDPYPAQVERTHENKTVVAEFEKLEGKTVTIVGRIMARRGHGKLTFLRLDDGTDSIQVLIKFDVIGSGAYSRLKQIDVGDFFQVTGGVVKAQSGEKSVAAESFKILAKSLRPLPEKWHGLQDEEKRYRYRYLDLLLDRKLRADFRRKSFFWRAIRDFMQQKGFLEVETPVLENTPGGAEARPFVTRYNALDTDVYLRISPELWLKRLMIAGFPKVFEMGRIFRNEGMDTEHLQDYTQLEYYWAYADYHDGMKLVEELYREVVSKTFGTLKFTIKGFKIDLGQKWAEYDFVDLIKQATGLNVLQADLQTIEAKLRSLRVEYDRQGFNLTRAVDSLWKHCRKKIAGPGFLINIPVMMEPLAKRMRSNPQLVERFQVILAGSEMGKGFSELNDPLDQAARFAEQAKMRAAGDEEAQRFDRDFVEALEYGMPPVTGFGVSERLYAFLCDRSVREMVMFPLLRSRLSSDLDQTLASSVDKKK